MTNEQPPVPTASGRSGPNVSLVLFGVLVVGFVAFFLQNSEKTSIDFLFFEKVTTIRWSLLMAMLFGVLLDRLFSIWWRRQRRKKD